MTVPPVPEFEQQPQGYETGPGPGGYFDGAASVNDLTRPLYGATFGQAVTRFFKNYVNFKGRASRSEYWWVALFSFLVQLIPGILMTIGSIKNAADLTLAYSNMTADDIVFDDFGTPMLDPAMAGLGSGMPLLVIGGILSGLIGLAMLLPLLGLAWRRLHDGNFAGPLYLLNLVPYAGGLAVFVLMLMPSKPAGRRFDRV